MGRYSSGVTLIDNIDTLSITKVKQWGHLDNIGKSSTITWSKNGVKKSSINITTEMSDRLYIILSYKYGESELVKYKVAVTYIESNLGIGEIPYFICPYTKKKCRNLYSTGKYFLHRDAISNGMYENQTESKKMRQFTKVMGPYYRIDKVIQEFNSKHFKNFYNGKPTKRFVRLNKKLNKVDRSFDYGAFLERALIS